MWQRRKSPKKFFIVLSLSMFLLIFFEFLNCSVSQIFIALLDNFHKLLWLSHTHYLQGNKYNVKRKFSVADSEPNS